MPRNDYRRSSSRDRDDYERGDDDDDHRDRDRRDHGRRHRGRHDGYGRDDDDEHRDAYDMRRRRDGSGAWPLLRRSRRNHRHLFAWVIVAGGVLVLGLIVVALLNATGLSSQLQSAYYTAAAWVLPDSWEAGFQALPGWVHAFAAVGLVAVLAGMASELFEAFD